MKQQTFLPGKTKLLATVSLLSFSMAVNAASLFPSTLKLSSFATPLIDSVADDFNGDGNIDLAVVFKSTPGGVQVLLGNDSGGLATSSLGAMTGNNPGAVASGDFNADGKTDLVVVNTDDNSISVLLGDGSGAFAATPGSPISVGTTPLDTVVDDFNADGKMDIAVANTVDSTVSILLGDGSGGFTATPDLPVTDTNPVAIVAGDVNADSKVDLLVANNFSGTVSVLLGDGAGGFNAAISPVTGNKPMALAMADFNGDGGPDLAVANVGSASVTVLLGNGSGGFNAIASPYTVGSKPIDLKVADVNGDGKADIVTANLDGENFSVLLGDGSGGFGAVINTANSAQPMSIVLNDFDGDGNADISATNSDGTISQLWGKGSGKFHNTVKAFSVVGDPSSIAVGDVNNDGSPDLVVASSTGTAGNIKVLENSGNGDFSNILMSVTLGTTSALSKVVLADVVGDANIDLVVTNSVDGKVAVLTGNGTGSFAAITGSPFTVGSNPLALAVGDMNNDGKADLVIANKGSNNVSLLLNNSTGGFLAATNWSVGVSPVAVALIDQNADANLDLITTNQGSDNLTLRNGTGSGSFTGSISSAPIVGSVPVSIAFGNLDSDTLIDRIVVNKGNDTLGILLGTGVSSTLSVAVAPVSVVIGDFNGDSKPDIAALTPGIFLVGSGTFDSLLYVFLGDGAGAFSLAPGFPLTMDGVGSGASEADLVTADFNGDGLADLVLVNIDHPVVKVLLNLDPRPVAKTDTVTINQNTSVTTGNVLSNDVDANQTGSLTITAVDTSSANGGSVTDNGDNTFTYLPPAGFTGTDSFNYIITDGWTKTASGKVSVTVNAVAAPSGGGGGSLNLYLLLLLPVLFFLRYININFSLGYLHRKCLRQL